MSVCRNRSVLSLLILANVSGSAGGVTLSVKQVTPPVSKSTPTPEIALPSEQETSLTALEANAAKYPPGLLVTNVTKDSPAEKAGLKVGDLLLRLNDVALRFVSQIRPLCEQARWNNKTTITLAIKRGIQHLQMTMAVVPQLGFKTQPPLTSPAATLYAEANALPPKPQAVKLEKYKIAAQSAERAEDARGAAWLWNEIYLDALEGSIEESEAWRNGLRMAAKAGDALLTATSLTSIGAVAYSRGQLNVAQDYFQRALGIDQKLAPNSLDVAEDLNNLGVVAKDHGQLDVAQGYHMRAFVIKKNLAPDSLDVASSLTNLGAVASERGLLDVAQGYLQRALGIDQKLAPNSLDVAKNLNNLGSVAAKRDKFDLAQDYYRRALGIRQKLVPDSLDVAVSLDNLGAVASKRGQLGVAQDYHMRALSIRENLAPDSLDVAASLTNLGNVAFKRDQLDLAQDYYQRALVIQQKYAPNSVTMAKNLINLGIVAVERGQLDGAEAYYQRALAIEQEYASNSLDVAENLNNLGVVAEKRGQLDVAQDYYQRAFAIERELAPSSLVVAKILANLGDAASARNKFDVAQGYYQHAWRIVQFQGSHVGGDTGRQDFGQIYGYIVARLVRTQLQRHRPEAAFATLEQGRAQALLHLIAERGLTEKVTPPVIWGGYKKAESAHNIAFKQTEESAIQVEQARRLLQASQEQKTDAAALKDRERAFTEAKQVFATKQSEEVRTQAEMESRWIEVRRAAKAVVPEPLNTNTVRTRLSPGTLVLEFAIGDKQGTLFAITSENVHSYSLTASRKELEAVVQMVRRFVARDTSVRTATLVSSGTVRRISEAEGQKALRILYGKLFPSEVQAAIRKAKHLVVSPDVFLWDLPFGALVTNTQGAPVYLGQQKPLSYTQSLTLYLQPARSDTLAHKNTKVRSGADVLIVGNPLYDNKDRNALLTAHQKQQNSAKPKTTLTLASMSTNERRRNSELGTLTRDSIAPPQLPNAQAEARQIAALYYATAHTGLEPTEAWFRQHAPKARIIHLATHGFLNPFAAQSSGILLAVPSAPPPVGQYDNDGALQAWEVWSLHLNADLVVLSACETGRGAQVTGEGLVGLTRAWQYAGAKTIVSSLWKVSDASTSALMTAFHRELRKGCEKDEALRRAMVATAKSSSGAWSAPYHWAAFVLVGDTGPLH